MKKSEEKIYAKDFGEHIGGARKEMFHQHVSDSEIMELNEEDREKFIKKSVLWKTPKYEKMVEDGMDIVVAYAIKKIRDAIPASPRSIRLQPSMKEQLIYTNFVQTIKETVEKVKTKEDLLNLRKIWDKIGIIDHEKSFGKWSLVPGEICGQNLTNNLYKALYLTDFVWYEKENRIPSGYQIVKRSFDSDRFKANTYFVAKGYFIIENNIDSYEKALNIAKEHAKSNKKQTKKRFVPPQLEHAKRTGLPEILKEKVILGEDYLESFHIRGGEFGKWMSEKDAEASLRMGYESFCNLASIIGIPKEDISLHGKLAITFGARGKGSAVAHYEPTKQVINLTKMHGCGSLAHEYFHAIDDIFGKEFGYGKMLTEVKNSKIPDCMKNVIDTMIYNKTIDENGKEILTRTDYYNNSVKMDRFTAKTDKGYWSSTCEMFARAGACFVTDELRKIGAQNDYLSGHSEVAIGYDVDKKNNI